MGKALHEQAAEYIRARILSGEYAVGSQIPTENELCALLGVSRPTLRQALDTLTREGLIVRIKGKGTFAVEPKVVHESTRFVTGYRAESEKNHRTVRTRVLYIGQERAAEPVAHALELPLGARVTRLVRLRHLEGYHNNAPVVYTTVYVPHKLFADMDQLDFTDLSFYAVLSERHLEVRHASRQLEVVPPPEEVAARLEISPFEPAIYITSVGRMASGRPIEYTESYYPAGSSRFLIEVHC